MREENIDLAALQFLKAEKPTL